MVSPNKCFLTNWEDFYFLKFNHDSGRFLAEQNSKMIDFSTAVKTHIPQFGFREENE